MNPPSAVTLQSVLTCPACGQAQREICSYGSVPCPPVQERRGCF